MRGVDVEETAAVRAELLDRDLRCSRAACDDLRRDRSAVSIHRGVDERCRRMAFERLHDALRYEDDREHDRQRDEHVERAPREVHPEAAEVARGLAREATNQRDEDGHARRRRHEVLHGQREHLRQVAHRRLAAVALPVRIGGEAHGRVERDLGCHRSERVRVEWERRLQTLKGVHDEQTEDVEDQEGSSVAPPPHLFVGANAGRSIEEPFDRADDALCERRLAHVHARHVTTERHRERDEHDDVQRALEDRVASHPSFSGCRSAKKR